MFKRPVNRFEATATLFDVSIKIGSHPIHCANYLIRFEYDALDNSQMEYPNTSLALTLHSLYRYSISRLHFRRFFILSWLFPLCPAKHPNTLLEKFLVLVFNSTPCCTHYPIIWHSDLRF